MMEEEPLAYYVEEHVTQPLSVSSNSINYDPSGTSDSLLSALRIRDHQTMGKKRIVKNLLVMFSSFFIFFLGFQSLSNLQTTMNSDKGIGVESQALIYAASMISSILLPEFLIKTIGCKRTIVFMFLCSVPYLVSNYKPSFGFIMPCSILMGIAIGPLNTAGAFYVNEMSLRYYKISKSESMETILARFFGLMSFFLENTQIWGNLVSYYILRPAMMPLMNHTNTTCGINFVKNPDGNGTNPNLEPPSEDKRYILVSIYVLSAVIAASLMGLFMDKLENDIQREEGGQCKAVLWRLLAAAKHAILPDQILLLPLSILVGMELAFYTGEITQVSAFSIKTFELGFWIVAE
ncbi:UNC93-like protein [Araneus ventricosus]|uniref:UNC93-like protein n=1 Tax=Araneus ventricosus TaxID=182803 RepID=A0A4Y2CCI3_ARAVE|nr:UNC93-like protein [Araneus ventricosus]